DYAWETAPPYTVDFGGLVRAHPREVSRLAAWGTACAPIRAMTAWRLLAPASLTGAAVSRACAWATLGTDALHRLRERIRLTTFRGGHQQVGGGCLCPRGGSRGASGRRSPVPPCPPCRCGVGAGWWLSPRPRHDVSYQGFRSLLLPDHCPPMRP